MKRFRFIQTGSASNWWSIAEFRVYNAAPSLLNRSGWSATGSASGSGTTASDTLDGSLSTRWTNGYSQANGQWFQVDMGKIQSISSVTLNAASFTGDYPRGYAVDLSIDGTNWQRVVTQTGSAANW
ncbi:discoidin domain-containing protein [Paenibacillus sp. LHD-38]|uniref:discoidin domain-containing protein n=1 Tax=Paenibacillus sp. LHD-38 TaxID=3072143 RepID=UPI00280EA04F|nr:discoidin domain-containing protein [Paenibacillus sp. LHD-38]MDQ8734446.1 discoidin domain-containing protein [Paenibacillus sp. LHD-38]